MRIDTILCPVEVPRVSCRALALARRLAGVFGSRLVLHHDVASAAPEFLANSWMDAAERAPHLRSEEERAVRALDELLASLPNDLRAQGRVTHGPRAPAIRGLARQLPADLIVTATHGRTDPEHASLTERLLEDPPCPILSTHIGDEVSDPPDPLATPATGRAIAVVPVDFSPHALGAVRYAFDLAGPLGLDVHLLEVESRFSWEDVKHFGDEGLRGHRDRRVQESRWRLEALVPPETAGKIRCEVSVGGTVSTICEYVRGTGASLVVLGTHDKGPFVRMLTGTTSCSVLREVGCPVWFVPEGTVAEGRLPKVAEVAGSVR